MSYKLVMTVGAALSLSSLTSKEQKMESYAYPSADSVKTIQMLYLTDHEIIQKKKDKVLNDFQGSIEEFLKSKVEKNSSAELLQKWDLLVAEIGSSANFFNAMTLVEPKEDLRKDYSLAYQQLKEKMIQTLCDRKEIYDFFVVLSDKEKKQPSLDEQGGYYLDQILKEMKLEGLHLASEQRKDVKNLKIELSKLSEEFAVNIQEDQSSIWVKKEDLKGLSSQFIEQLPQNESGLCQLGCDYPTYFYVMKGCENSSVRKELYRSFMNRAYPKNDKVLSQMITKRDQMAKVLGFESYAHFQLSNEMVKDPLIAESFLDKLLTQSVNKQQKELASLKESFPSLELTAEGKLFPWDVLYIQEKQIQKKYQVDEDLVKEYFPLESTLSGLMQIYESFFDLKMTAIPIDHLWDQEVKLLRINDKQTDQVYGYILMDLFPRQNKYSHACHATIINGLELSKENNTISLSLVVANFPKPSALKPALMSLSDAKTFFHEFGHAIHAVMGRTRFASTSGTSVKVDFVELPSQMLEEWLWEPSILKMVSSHYQTKEKLSDELIEKILSTRAVSAGCFIGRQCLLSKLSLACFLPGENKDVDALLKQLHEKMNLYYGHDVESHFQVSFGHLDEYGARYYGYLWSRVFALDLFEEIKKEGLLNPKAGRRYIQEIIGKGGSEDPDKMLKKYLGRDPSQEAFLKTYGVQ